MSHQPLAISPVLEMFPQRRRSVAGALLVRFPVRAEFVRLQGANRETDLALLRRELDDFHRIGLADFQINLLVALADVPRFVEFRDVDETLDALVELHERTEVRQSHDLAFDSVAK